MKKVLFAVLFAAVTTGIVNAQDNKTGDLNRQMDVVRDYEPTVNRAARITIRPNMVDTVNLTPEINYSINYNPVSYRFEVDPINPARVNIWNRNSNAPSYAKIGLGYPFQSLADVYASMVDRGNGYLGAFINHYGSWSKIINDADIKSPASNTFNSGGILGEYRFGRYSVQGEVKGDYDMVTRYGYFFDGTPPVDFDNSASALRQHYSNLSGRAMFGNNFQDLSYFNFRVGVNGSMLRDNFDYGENSFGALLDLGKGFNDINSITLHTEYSGSRGSRSLQFNENIFNAAPVYHRKGEMLDLSVGVDYWYADSDFETKHLIAPKLDIRLNLANGFFMPYLTASGKMNSNNYRNLSRLNPYIQEGLVMPATSEFNARAGINGIIADAFSYRAYAGYTRYGGMVMFANYFNNNNRFGNTFIGVIDDTDMFTIGGDIEGRIYRSLSAKLAFQYLSYSMDNLEKAVGMPDMKGSFDVTYRHRDLFSVTAGAHLTGQRYFINYNVDTPADFTDITKRDAVVDLRLGCEVKILRNLDAFVDGRNLLNRKLYDFQYYRGLGANVMAGIKYTF